jgi:hypothetical protein
MAPKNRNRLKEASRRTRARADHESLDPHDSYVKFAFGKPEHAS